MVCSP